MIINIQRKYGASVAVVMVGAIIAGTILYGAFKSSGAETAAPNGTPGLPVVHAQSLDIVGSPYIGDANAPLTLIVWEDYQCPFCGKFETTVLPTLVAKYVDTGKVKIVFKDFAFLGNDSITAAEYEHAIWALYPDAFAAWRTKMFVAQDAEGDWGFGDSASIDTLITAIPDIDLQKVKTDIAINKAKYVAAIAAGQQEGVRLGIHGTPGFLVGEHVLSGAQPASVFMGLIDAQLNK